MADMRRSGLAYCEGDAIRPSGRSRLDVEKYAAHVAEIAKFDPRDDGDLSKLQKSFGGRIHVVNMDDLIDARTGAIYVHGKFDFDIQIPDYTSPLRDRFTVAHEFGHYFLHARQGKTPIIAFRRGSGRVEWEANWFAAALLMPSKEFAAALKKTQDISKIANSFGVSTDAAEIRRKALSL